MNTPFRVLIVEDLPLSVALVKVGFERHDPDVASEWAETLADALERLSKPGIDVVLLDLNLPDADGVKAVREIRDKFPDVPVVVLTGHAQEYRAAIRAGALGFLAKPQEPTAILMELRKAIALREVRSIFQPMKELVGELKAEAEEMKGLSESGT